MSEYDIKGALDKLWEKPSTHHFMSRMSRLLDSFSSDRILSEVLAYTGVRCQRGDYHRYLPQSMLGLLGVWQIKEFFQNGDELLPLTQMLWYAAGEARVPAVDIKSFIGTPPLEEDLSIEGFEKYFKHNDFEASYRILVFLLRKPLQRRKVFASLFRTALEDEVNYGNKLILLVRTFEYSEDVKWKQYEPIWFALLHQFMHVAPHIETYPTVDVFFKKHWKELISGVSNKHQSLTESFFEQMSETLFNDEKEQTLDKVLNWVREGWSSDDLMEAICLSSSRLVLEGSLKKWLTTVHAFEYADAVSSAEQFLDPQDQVKGLLMAALFVKRMAILSKPLTALLPVPLETNDEKLHALYFVEYWIRRGETSRALGALDHLRQTNSVDQKALEALAFISSKNLYSIFNGHDIHFSAASLKRFSHADHDLKTRYLEALVKLLAESPKELTIYQGLINLQKVKRGYYTAPGRFNF